VAKGRQERNSALWGSGGGRKRHLVVLVSVIALIASFASSPAQAKDKGPKALVPQDLYAQAVANPAQLFNVIVQGSKGSKSDNVNADLAQAQKDKPGVAKGLYRKFRSISGVAATVSGAQLVALAEKKSTGVITLDTKTTAQGDFTSTQLWPEVSQLTSYWQQANAPGAATAPTIAFLDSGIDAGNPAFGGRVLDQENFYSGSDPNSPGDGLGHGTFAAGIAAGADAGHAGGTPNAGLVSLDVLDNQGAGSTSDMIAALDWVLQNKATYHIGVVNISIADSASGVQYAPANDPFIMTVGATDTNNTVSTADDFAAPWSAWGATNDGFRKPEISAPGRYMEGPVPAGSTLPGLMPDRVTSPGYMWMSGTSFSAPVVAAAAAYVLALHPSWTPDQVKGALMETAADQTGYTGGGAMGVGEVQAAAAATTADGNANPNLGLNQYVGVDPTTGLNQFNGDAWTTAATNDPTWNAMSWASMSWASSSWSTMSWASMSWASMSWASMSWASMSWASMSWASQSWASSTRLK
jgi:serine protease AprX